MMEWLSGVLGNQAFITFIGALVGVTAGALLKGFFEEKGKSAATKKDIDKVLEEVALITQKTKTIEARVNGRLWEDQSRWSRKESFYVGVIEEIEAAINAVQRAESEARRELESLETPPDSENTINRALDEFQEHVLKLREKFMVGRIFVEPSVQSAWSELFEKWNTAYGKDNPLKGFEDFGKSAAQLRKEDRQRIRQIIPKFIEALAEMEEALLRVATTDLRLHQH